MLNFFVCLIYTVSAFLVANSQWMVSEIENTNYTIYQDRQFQMPYQPIGMSCIDTAINCQENALFCNQPYYETTMRSQCARTCRFCQESATLDFDSGRCRDVNSELVFIDFLTNSLILNVQCGLFEAIVIAYSIPNR